jgi:hypothetical protein
VAAAAQEGYGLRMLDEDLVGEPVWEDVEPRPLTPCEQAMVDQLVSTVDSDELAEQARTSDHVAVGKADDEDRRLLLLLLDAMDEHGPPAGGWDEPWWRSRARHASAGMRRSS